jgi:flagellar FliJ protein
VKKSKRLALVQRLAEIRERQAAIALGQRQQQSLQAQQQFQQLMDYRGEYRQSLQTLGSQGISGQVLRRHIGFMNDLEQAISVQHQHVTLAEQQCKQATAEWQRVYGRRRSMAELVDRVRWEEERDDEKKLQKEVDDHVATRWLAERRQ